jgi:hypothetical protein
VGHWVRILSRQEEIIEASNNFSRVVEGNAITGNVGVVMGREVVKPRATSNLGKLHPSRTLQRRFTKRFPVARRQVGLLARQVPSSRQAERSRI